jgi:hypothetical protein
MLVPNFAPARSVSEAIQEVKMVQVCSFHEFNSWLSISQLVCSLHAKFLGTSLIHTFTLEKILVLIANLGKNACFISFCVTILLLHFEMLQPIRGSINQVFLELDRDTKLLQDY